MRVAAIIPLYNGAAYIDQSLRSVLEQSRPVDEIVVVDDGSIDNGAEIAQSIAGHLPHFKLLRKSNGGQASARNFGVANSTSELIAMLDQDDAWYPVHVERLVAPFEAGSVHRLGWTYSNLDNVDENGLMMTRSFLPTKDHPKKSIRHCLANDMYVLPSASIVMREAFTTVGGFDEQLVGYEDDDLFLRLFRAGFDNLFIDEPLSFWRIHNSSTSFGIKMSRSRLKYARKLLRAFPDNPHQNLFFARDLIAPRFVANFISDLHKSVRFSEPEVFMVAREGLLELIPHLHWRRKLLLAPIRPALASYGIFRLLYRSGALHLARALLGARKRSSADVAPPNRQ